MKMLILYHNPYQKETGAERPCRNLLLDDVCLSLPVLLGNGQVQGRIMPSLTEGETEKLHKSGKALKDVIAQLDI